MLTKLTVKILVKIVTIVVTTPVSGSTICIYILRWFQSTCCKFIAYTVMLLLLELIPGATRPLTDINNNNNITVTKKFPRHLQLWYVSILWHFLCSRGHSNSI